jgi:hypothetical protein
MGAFAGLGVISREIYHRRRAGTSEITPKPLKAGVLGPDVIHYCQCCPWPNSDGPLRSAVVTNQTVGCIIR